MKAEQVIAQIKSETIELFGQNPLKNNHPWEVRNELQKMAETNQLPPKEYYRALKLTWHGLSDRTNGQAIEQAIINKKNYIEEIQK